MVRAGDLRIGNVIKPIRPRHNEEYITVNSISLEEINSDFRSYSLEDLDPIPLSEEILLKCGFDPRKFNNIRDDYQDRLLEFEFIENSLDLWISDEKNDQSTYFRLDNIKHLHQLQNLYHSLTGQELNLHL